MLNSRLLPEVSLNGMLLEPTLLHLSSIKGMVAKLPTLSNNMASPESGSGLQEALMAEWLWQ